MYEKVVFFLKAERAVHLALEEGLAVGGTNLAVDLCWFVLRPCCPPDHGWGFFSQELMTSSKMTSDC
ncbi:hypothetical protein scyTo_0003891 [Scyliorhinus torazame]|uniref:Uncharacterized protein n=1 Tax=Scyliorhinus torazame TaxID=75743 RepID=A0A401PNW2_SCYTO|nr:hypothetical protein [Scyliorhinus torazame]